MPPLPLSTHIDLILKPPHLRRNPPIPHTLHMALRDPSLLTLLPPPPPQKLIVPLMPGLHLRQRLEPAPPLDLAEDVVGVAAPLAVEGAQLGRALDAAGQGRGDVDVGGAGVVFVLLGGEGDGGVGDGFAG